MSLGDTHDTVGANLALTDGGEHANQTHGNANAEHHGAGFCYATHKHEEGNKAVDTLCGRKGAEYHIVTGTFRFALEGAFCRVARGGGSHSGTDT